MNIKVQNNVNILKEISEMILSKRDTEDTINKILDLINSKIKSQFLIYFLIDPKSNEIVMGSFTDERFKFVKHLIHFDLFKIRYPKTSETLIAECVRENKITRSNQLKDFFYPVFKFGGILNKIQKIIGIKCCMALPIKLQEKVIGAIFIASKNDNFSDEETNLLEVYTNMASIAIGNNLQFQEISKQYELEKETTSILSHEIRTPIAIAHHSSQSILMSLEKYKDGLDKHLFQELTKEAQEIRYGMDRLSRISSSIFKLREVENRIPEDIHVIDLKKQLGQIVYIYEKKPNRIN